MEQAFSEKTANKNSQAEGLNTVRSVISKLPIPCLLFWSDDALLYCNDSYSRQAARNSNTIFIEGTPAEKYLHETWPVLSPLIKKIFGTDKALPAPKGLFPFLENAYDTCDLEPVSDPTGRTCGVLVSFIAKEAGHVIENMLIESEGRFRALVNASSDVVYRMSPDWKEMRQLAGRGFLTDTGTPDGQWMQKYIHPKDQERVREVFEQAVRDKTTFELEHQVMQADGSIGWTFSRAVPILDGDGQIIEWFGAASDITRRRGIEEALRIARDELEVQRRLYDAITGSTPDLVYAFDLNYKFVYANLALLNMWGRNWEESKGLGLLALGYEPWHAEMHEREIDEVVATKKPIRGEVSFPHATLGKRIYDYIFAPILNENGEVELIAGTTRDISDLKVAEEALKQSEEELRTLTESLERLVAERTKELKRSNEDLLQFAHVASHDLKEPVRKIRTFLNRLIEDTSTSLSEDGKKFVAKIGSAADRMHQMIEGVLRYSTMTNLNEDMVEIDLNQTLQQIEADLEVIIQERKTNIQFTDLPVIEGAPVLIYQLFYNLLNNSLKFAKKEMPAQVRVTAKSVVREGKPFVLIEVTDNGIGFPQEYAENIFNTFTRLNAKDQYEGTGLGLALCKKIVERHGGTISATATVNEGAVFSICLPVKQ